MGTTGLIYVAIAAAWLAYLVPHFLKRREDAAHGEADPSERFSDSVRIIRTGAAPVVDHEYAVMDVEISTPMTRRVAVRELRASERRAAARRRRVLVALAFAVTLVLTLCVAGVTPWWTLAIPGGLVLAFVVVARISVRAMRAYFDERYELITHGSDETTIFLSRKAVRKSLDEVVRTAAAESAADAAPAGSTGGLWEPLPITVPTYVSKPLAPRTVRTIDLSAPDLSAAARSGVPVTADGPDPLPGTAAPDGDRLRVVGE